MGSWKDVSFFRLLFVFWSKTFLSAASLDEMFMAKYIESSGNPREFVWKGLLENLAT